jgi:hypothetical protein
VPPREPSAYVCPEPTDPAQADRPHVPRPMRLSHFLSSLSHLVPVSAIFWFRSAICHSELNHFWYSELSHFSYSKLCHFSYRAQSFYDFVSHSTTMTTAIRLENSVIPRCYSTQPIFCYSAQPFCNIAQSFYVLLQ